MRQVKFDFTEITDPVERVDRINALADTLYCRALRTTLDADLNNNFGWFAIHMTDREYDLLKKKALWFSHYAGFDSLLFRDDRFRPVNALSYPARDPRIVKSRPPYWETWIYGVANPIPHLAKGF